jgi:molecular chaperone HscB
VTLQDDDFELFGLDRQFAQDRSEVDARWKELQREAHPDKFASQGAAAQRIAMQWSVRINEAYQRLKDPIKRAAYLCELAGFPVNVHTNTAMPNAFLMQQMEWREALDDARGLEPLEELSEMVQNSKEQVLHHCAVQLDEQHDYAAAVGLVRILMFIEKFAQDLNQRLDQFA